MEDDQEKISELVNVFAILSGVATKEQVKGICSAIVNEQLAPCSLSMTLYKYQALMKVDKNAYQKWILEKVRTTYKKMLDAGATSVWEIEDCIAVFGDAGSLCHAWSSVPVYVFHELGVIKYV